jgi:hypothetical protein
MHIAEHAFGYRLSAVGRMLLGALIALLLRHATVARADVFELVGGGRLEGKLAQSADADKSNYVIELSTGGRVTIARSQVTKIDNISDVEAQYEKLVRTSPDTVESHWKLAEWCRGHKLVDKYQRHLERIIELDPNHEDARAALGFRQKDGQWMSRDDMMANKGMVMYKGRFVTPQHVELMEQQKEARITQADWNNNIERLRRGLTSRREENVTKARAELALLNDPQAAEAVVAVLHRERDPGLKQLWVEALSRLDSRAAVDALVDLSLTDPDEEVRRQSLEYLTKAHHPGLVTPYIHALRDTHNEIVNRAGAALGQIRDRDAIGPLIDALVTKHKVKVSDANPDQHAYTFSPDGGAFSFGSSGPQVVTTAVRNPDVLAALVTLSGGTSFDYDQPQWRTWLAAQAKLNAVDLRRDQ